MADATQMLLLRQLEGQRIREQQKRLDDQAAAQAVSQQMQMQREQEDRDFERQAKMAELAAKNAAIVGKSTPTQQDPRAEEYRQAGEFEGAAELSKQERDELKTWLQINSREGIAQRANDARLAQIEAQLAGAQKRTETTEAGKTARAGDQRDFTANQNALNRSSREGIAARALQGAMDRAWLGQMRSQRTSIGAQSKLMDAQSKGSAAKAAISRIRQFASERTGNEDYTDLVGYKGPAQTATGNFLDKAHGLVPLIPDSSLVVDPKQQTRLNNFMFLVDRQLVADLKNFIGVAQSKQELERALNAVVARSMSPNEFQAALEELEFLINSEINGAQNAYNSIQGSVSTTEPMHMSLEGAPQSAQSAPQGVSRGAPASTPTRAPMPQATPQQGASPNLPAYADGRERRTINGETRVWNGVHWVAEQ